LCSQGRGQVHWFSAEQRLDLVERQADEFQRDDLLERLKVLLAVDAIAGLGPRRCEKPQAVVVMKRDEASERLRLPTSRIREFDTCD
jgi:hypothetical protein